jgi:hypothetical protein
MIFFLGAMKVEEVPEGQHGFYFSVSFLLLRLWFM